MKIYNAALSNCGVVQDGRAVRLDLVDDKGTEVSLELSFERAQAIAKTLPSLLTRALQTVTGNASSRFVLTPDRWTVEQSKQELLGEAVSEIVVALLRLVTTERAGRHWTEP